MVAKEFYRLFPTHEIGSIRKLNATVLALQKKSIHQKYIEEIYYWWNRLKITDPNIESFIQKLKENLSYNEENKKWEKEILHSRLIFNIRFLESTGLDFIYTGEAFRREMYEHFVREIKGIYLEDQHIRSFDDRFYRPGVRVQNVPIQRKNPITIEEFECTMKITKKPLRLCLTGPYTIFDWTVKPQGSEQFFFDLIKNVFVPETLDAVKAGAKFISLDEPANTSKPYERELFLEGYKLFFKAVGETARKNDVKIGFHTCYSDNYSTLFEDLPKLPWDFVSLEVGNRDLKALGTTEEARPAFKNALDMMIDAYNNECKAKVTLGVLEVHADKQFSSNDLSSGIAENKLRKLIRDRIIFIGNYLFEQLGEVGPYYLMIGPDCGLRPVNDFRVLHMMLRAMVEGANDARNRLMTQYGLPEYLKFL